MTFSPDGRLLATGAHDDSVQLWATPALKLVATLEGHDDVVWRTSFAPQGGTFASASSDATVGIFDSKKQTLVNRLLGHGATVTSVAWSPSERLIASASADGTARLWRPTRVKSIAVLEHPDWVRDVSFSRDGSHFATACDDGLVRVYSTISRTLVVALAGHVGPVCAVAFAGATAELIVSGGADNAIRVWRIADARPTAELKGHDGRILSVTTSPLAPLAASGGADRRIILWDLYSLSELTRLTDETDWIRCVSLGPANWMSTLSAGDRPKLWRVGDMIKELLERSDKREARR